MVKFKLKDCKENKDFNSRVIQGVPFYKDKWSYRESIDERIIKNFSHLVDIETIDIYQYTKEIKAEKEQKIEEKKQEVIDTTKIDSNIEETKKEEKIIDNDEVTDVDSIEPEEKENKKEKSKKIQKIKREKNIDD